MLTLLCPRRRSRRPSALKAQPFRVPNPSGIQKSKFENRKSLDSPILPAIENRKSKIENPLALDSRHSTLDVAFGLLLALVLFATSALAASTPAPDKLLPE